MSMCINARFVTKELPYSELFKFQCQVTKNIPSHSEMTSLSQGEYCFKNSDNRQNSPGHLNKNLKFKLYFWGQKICYLTIFFTSPTQLERYPYSNTLSMSTWYLHIKCVQFYGQFF